MRAASVPETLHVVRQHLHRLLAGPWVPLLLGAYALATLLAVGGAQGAMRRLRGTMSGGLDQRDASVPALSPDDWYRGVLRILVDDPVQAAYLAEFPPAVLLLFVVNLICLPWLAVLLGFGMVSSDARSGAIRFVVLRARRGSILVGRFLACLALVASVILLTHTVVFALVVAWGQSTAIEAALRLSYSWLGLISLSFVWLTIMSWSSAQFPPFGALVVGAGAVLATILLHAFESLSRLHWLLPGHYAWLHLSPRSGLRLVGLGGLLIMGLFYLAAARHVFRRRDL